MCWFNLVCVLYDLPSLSYFDLILTLYHKIKSLSQIFMLIEISQSRHFKYLNVYVVKDANSYDCFPNHHTTFCSQKCFYFKTPDGAASISSHSYFSCRPQLKS